MLDFQSICLRKRQTQRHHQICNWNGNSRSLDTPHFTPLVSQTITSQTPSGGDRVEVADQRESCASPVGIQTAGRGGARALTSRAGCSHGGATRTAPPPPSRFHRAPARLFSVPKIQDSDPPSQSRRSDRHPSRSHTRPDRC